MRINSYIAKTTGISRRQADKLIKTGRITVNSKEATVGMTVDPNTNIQIDGHSIKDNPKNVLIALNKPIDYVVSRNGQGAKTIYELLPTNLHHLKPIGRLDKNSSGLLLLTNDGKLAQYLSHPSNHKIKTYSVTLDRSLNNEDQRKIKNGIRLEDGLSRLTIKNISLNNKTITIELEEGRNRQIRRTFAALGYKTVILHRVSFGNYQLLNLPKGQWRNETIE